jgi:formiminoglutamase
MAKADDPRLGTIISSITQIKNTIPVLTKAEPFVGTRADIVIVGMPCEEGVRRNGGRLGARLGPSFFRNHLVKMGAVVNSEFGIDLRSLVVGDAGDVCTPEENDLEQIHTRLRGVVKDVLDLDAIPFVVGGGNDQSFPNSMGLVDKLLQQNWSQGITVINIDAHLDGLFIHNGN